MNYQSEQDPDAYYQASESWAADRERARASGLRTAWIVAAVAATIALLEAVALAMLVPLKTTVPYTLLVDRQTGYIQALKPLNREMIAPDRALTRSLLAQYVIAREGFDIDSVRDDYRKVALWSNGDARDRYIAAMQPNNPQSPFARLPRRALVEVEVEVRSISALANDTALVRFATTRSDPGGQRQPPQLFVAVIRYKFSGAAMSAADRLVNPLGFQVQRYRRDAELPLEPVSPPTPAPQSTIAPAPATASPALVRSAATGPRVLPAP